MKILDFYVFLQTILMNLRSLETVFGNILTGCRHDVIIISDNLWRIDGNHFLLSELVGRRAIPICDDAGILNVPHKIDKC